MPGRTEDFRTSDRATGYSSWEAEAYAEKAQDLLDRYRDPAQEPADREDLTGRGYENNLWHRQWRHELDPQADGQGEHTWIHDAAVAGRLRAMRFAMEEGQEALAGIREVQKEERYSLIYRQDQVEADADHNQDRIAEYEAETGPGRAAARLARHAGGLTELGVHLTYRGLVEDNEELTATGMALMNSASQSFEAARERPDGDHRLAEGAGREQHELDHPTGRSLLNPQSAEHALELADVHDTRVAGIATRFMARHNAMGLVNQDLGNSMYYGAERASPDEVEYALDELVRRNLNPQYGDNAAAAFIEACGGDQEDVALHHLNRLKELQEFVMDVSMNGQDLAENAKARYEGVSERLNADDRQGAGEALEAMLQSYQQNDNPTVAEQHLEAVGQEARELAARYARRENPAGDGQDWNDDQLQGSAVHRRAIEAAVLIEALERRQGEATA